MIGKKALLLLSLFFVLIGFFSIPPPASAQCVPAGNACGVGGPQNGGCCVGSLCQGFGIGSCVATSELSTISGYVYFDYNGNSLPDINAGEGYPGATVTIIGVGGYSGISPQTTDAQGLYTFRNVPAGWWYISVQVPSQYQPVTPASADFIVPPSTRANFKLNIANIPPTPTKPPSCALAGKTCQISKDCQDGSTACGIYSCVVPSGSNTGTCQNTVLTPTSTPKPAPTNPGTVTPTPTSGTPAPTPVCFQETHSCGAHDAPPPGTETNEGCCTGLTCQDKNAVGDGTCKPALTGPALQIIITPTPICSNSPVDITAKVCPASASTKFTIIQNSEITKPNEQTVTADAQGIAVVKGFSFNDPQSGSDTNAVNIHVVCGTSEGNDNFSIVKCATPTLAPSTPPHCALKADGTGPDVDANGFCLSVESAIGNIPTRIGSFINRLIGFLIGIGAGIAVIIIIYAGYKLMTSQGNPEAIQNAKDLITSAIVGILFLVFSVLILEVIGVDILHIPFWNYGGGGTCGAGGCLIP